MTPSSGGNENFQFYYFPRSGGFQVTVKPVPRDGQWHTVEIDYSSDTNWKGDIAAFRIDPGHGASLTLEIDSAYFMPDNAANISVATTNLPDGMWNTPYQSQLSSTNGIGITTWSLISGTLQTGLSLSQSGMITGTPTEVGIESLTFEVNDQLARSSTKQLTLEVVPEPGIIWIVTVLGLLLCKRNTLLR